MNKTFALIASIIVPELVGSIGTIFTVSAIPGWYAGLTKVPWNPPGWLFGPVWTLLYALMGVAAWLVWRKQPSAERTQALKLYGLQLLLNGLWTPIFFGLHAPFAGLVVIVGLLVALVATMLQFWKVDRIAGAILVPYLLWIIFATTLNFGIWWLN